MRVPKKKRRDTYRYFTVSFFKVKKPVKVLANTGTTRSLPLQFNVLVLK